MQNIPAERIQHVARDLKSMIREPNRSFFDRITLEQTLDLLREIERIAEKTAA